MNINLFASGGKTTRINNLRNIASFAQLVDIYGARGRTRTGTGLLPRDFKSLASTNFATRASGAFHYHFGEK